MIEYDVICKLDLTVFKEAVKEKLKEGWKLQGGVAYGGAFMQAIYKETTTTTTKGGKK